MLRQNIVLQDHQRFNKQLEANNLGKGAKYKRSRNPVELLGASLKMTRSNALKLEHRVKKKYLPTGNSKKS